MVEAVAENFEQAYTAHWVDVFRFAFAWTNDWASAEDLAQDAFARLWRSRAQLDWTRPIMPWLLRVTRNAATDRFRSMRRLVIGASSAPNWRNDQRDTWMDVTAAMGRLTRVERSALLSMAVLGLNAVECGAILGISDSAVRAAASRARKKLETER